MNWDKCHFGQQQFDYLGVTLTADKMQPSEEVLSKFAAAKMPTTLQGWRQLFGWLAHLARFIWWGHELLRQAKALQKSPSSPLWQQFLSQLQRSFLRVSLPSPTTRSWTLVTDASKSGWGAVLIVGRTVVRCAHGLWPASFRHHMSNELELEAVCRALSTFRPWVFGHPVRVVVDNQAVLSFANPNRCSDFLRRRLSRLLDFSPSLFFSPGPFNFFADFLSRQAQWLGMVSGGSCSSLSRAQWKVAHAGHFGVKKTFL